MALEGSSEEANEAAGTRAMSGVRLLANGIQADGVRRGQGGGAAMEVGRSTAAKRRRLHGVGGGCGWRRHGSEEEVGCWRAEGDGDRARGEGEGVGHWQR